MAIDAMDFLSITGSILLALGGGSVIVFALAKWLGGVWANRILEKEKEELARQHELLVRRRDAYAKLAVALRLFLRRAGENPQVETVTFHEAYDVAALWAPDEVMNSIGELLDLITKVAEAPESVPQDELQSVYAECITSMRRDCGFPNTNFKYRLVSF